MNTGQLPLLLSGMGVLMVAGIVLEFGWAVTGDPPINIPFVAGVITSLPFAVLLATSWYWISKATISENHYLRIARWTLIGAVFFGGFFFIVAFQTLSVPWEIVGTIRWGLVVGSGCGFLVGFLNARSIERAISAEREATRAEEAERRRELLEYLNALLRHEVLNTATIIHGYADLLSEQEDNHGPAEIIQEQATELTRITKDVRLLLESENNGMEPEAVNVTTVIREELHKLEDRYPDIETEAEIQEEVYVAADQLIRRLFSNLFHNAVEHNERDVPRVSVTVKKRENVVRARIRDNGSGIPESERDELFTPSSDIGVDHGLGLVIVGRLVDRYDGTIQLTETTPEGSVFTIELPGTTPENGDTETHQ